MALSCSRATSPAELEEALALITRIYQKAGYVRKGEQSTITPYLRSPATATFLLRDDATLLGTLSVILDSTLGIPMEKLFGAEIAGMRRESAIFAEVGQFAIDRTEARVFELSMELFKAVVTFAEEEHLETLCIAVNPKHESFYRLLGFKQFAATRAYAAVENAPAVPMALTVSEILGARQKGVRSNVVLSALLGTR